MKHKICKNTLFVLLLTVFCLYANADTIGNETKRYGLFDKNGFLVESPNRNFKDIERFTLTIDLFPNYSIKSLVQKADSCIKKGNTEEGMKYLGTAVGRKDQDLSRVDKEWKALACSNLGYFFLVEKQDPTHAYYCFEKGIEIAKFLGPSERISRLACALYSNMGKLFMLFDDMPRTLFYYKKSFDLAMKIKDDESVINTYVDLAHCAWMLDAIDSIASENKEFRKYENKNTFQWLNKYVINLNEAIEASLQGDSERTLNCLDKSLNNIDIPFSTYRYYTLTYLIIAKTALISGKEKMAEKSLELADSTIARNNIIDLQDDLFKLQALCAKNMGNDSLYGAKLLQASSIRDSLFNMHEYGKILDMQSNWLIEKYDNDASRYKNQRLWMVLSLMIIIILAFGSVVGLLHRKRKAYLRNAKINIDQKTHISKSESVVPEESKYIYEKVKTFIDNDPAVFDMDFSIETLASSLGIKVHQISKAINIVTGKNFSTLIAEIRIREACRIMKEPVHPRPTMESVAEKVGYSRSHFLRVFKSVTGITTTEFLHNIGKENIKQ